MRGKGSGPFLSHHRGDPAARGDGGYLIAVPKLLRYSLPTAASATLLASLYTRYMQHRRHSSSGSR
jgi:hypothetical protein